LKDEAGYASGWFSCACSRRRLFRNGHRAGHRDPEPPVSFSAAGPPTLTGAGSQIRTKDATMLEFEFFVPALMLVIVIGICLVTLTLNILFSPVKKR
jgi:hypothetical protein